MDDFIRNYNNNPIETYTVRDINEFNTLNVIAQQNFKIFHMNIRSISKNIDELSVFLEQFEQDFDVIILSETFQILDLNLFKKIGYDVLYNEGKVNRNDGVLIYVKSNIKYAYTIKLISETNAIKLNISLANKKINITALYRSPSTCPHNFNRHLLNYLNDEEKVDINILVGDININIHSDSDFAQDYLNILNSNGFISYINKCTRIQDNQKSCIDHFFIKTHVDKIYPIIYEENITDHYPIIILIKSDHQYKKIYQQINYKKYINYPKLKTDLKYENWHEIYNNEDVNLITDTFINKLTQYILKNTKQIKIKNPEKPRKKWITKSLLQSIKTKNDMYEKVRKNPEDNNLKLEYKKYKNKLCQLIKTTKNQYYKSEINKNAGSSQNLWNTINNLCNKYKSNNAIKEIKTDDNITINNKKEIADTFVNYYSDLGKNYANKIKIPTDFRETEALLNNSMQLYPTNIDEVKKIINSLKAKKSPGFDSIRAETLKEIADEIAKPLEYIINKCFSTGDFPDSLKIGLIKPLYKGGEKNVLINYRPISVISNVAKIFEKIIKIRFTNFFKKYEIISENQFGFQQNKSTEDAIATLTRYIYKALDEKTPSLCIFVDLAKAFDTVCHKRLLYKLEKYGIRGIVLKLIRNYLSDRIQYVKIDDVISEPKTIQYGVPQGTVLGPILFTLYINSLLGMNNHNCKILSFADDTAIFFKGNTWEQLKKSAEKGFTTIKKWFDYNLLTVNFNKTFYMPFTSYSNNLPLFGPLIINSNLLIPESKSIKYLGIVFDRHLRWDQQINNVVTKIRGLLPKIKYLKPYLNINQLKILYYALVQSQLSYGIIGWGGVCNCYLEKLTVVQKWVLRIIYNKDYNYASDDLYKETEIFDLRQLYCSNMLTYNFKNKNNITPIEHQYETRNKENKCINPRCKKTIGQKSYTYFTSRIYNTLPNELKNINTLHLFKKKIKIWIKSEKLQINNIISST